MFMNIKVHADDVGSRETEQILCNFGAEFLSFHMILSLTNHFPIKILSSKLFGA